MEVNGWRLFQYPLFENQLRRLTEAVEQLSTMQPDTYKEHPKTKLLATIHRLITESIPRDPNAPEFRQGDTLGPDNRHWFRAKFHQRYRLFFRFSSKDKVIVYVWVNDESTLRKAGSRTDAYAVFKSMLDAGDPPQTLEALLKRAKEMRLEAKRSKQAAKYGAVLCWPEFAAYGDASMSLTIIFFDAGGTLVYPDLALTEWALASRGIFPADHQRYAAEREAKRQLDEARAEHHSVDAQYWDIYYLRLFHELGMAEDAELRAALVAATRKGTNWRQVRPGTREVLARLKRRYRIGLISNSDGSVRRLFEELGLDDCFDSFTDSHLCGCEKPDPRIFECAMASLGAMPQQSLYVGDIYSIDFLGAQGVGMSAVLMNLAGAYRDTSYPRVESLAEFESRFHALAGCEDALGEAVRNVVL